MHARIQIIAVGMVKPKAKRFNAKKEGNTEINAKTPQIRR
jgi:hypothetical protein